MLVEVSIGEAVDKYNVLEIKLEKIKDSSKIIEIEKELLILKSVREYIQKFEFFYKLLYYVNEKIWVMTDNVKKTELTDPAFALLSNQIFEYNQKRFRLKNFFNTLCDSSLKEQKGYSANCCKLTIDNEEILLDKIAEINYLTIDYDIVYIETNDGLVDKIKSLFKAPTIVFTKIETSSLVDLKNYTINPSIKHIFSFNPITYLAGGKMGDFVQSLSVINENFYNTGRKGIVYLSEKGDTFRTGLETTYKDTYDVVTKQRYVHDYFIYKNEQFVVDLTAWRNSPLLYRENWSRIYTDFYNITWGKNKWITFEAIDEDIIFVSTNPYRFPVHSEFFTSIKRYIENGQKIIFMSDYEEYYHDFIRRTQIHIPFYKLTSFTEMIKIIHSCKLFIGNLSAPLAIAFACHKKNIVGFCSDNNDNIHNKNMYLSQVE